MIINKFVGSSSQLNKKTKVGQQIFKNDLENGQETRFRYEKVKKIDLCLLYFSLMNILFSVLYSEADYIGKERAAMSCLYINCIFSFIQVFVTILRYKSQIQLQKSQKILHQSQDMISSKKIYQIIGQIIIFGTHPYPLINNYKITTQNVYDNFEFEIKLNYMLVIVGFAKIFIITRAILLSCSYIQPRSSRICRLNGTKSNYLYAIKCYFKQKPILLICCSIFLSILDFSICFRIAQRNLVNQYPKHFEGTPYPLNLQKFQNALWLTIITMASSGFGDYYPRTIFGRLIDVFLIIWGSLMLSLLVVVLTNYLNIDQAERRSLIILRRLQTKKQLKQSAAFLITNSCKQYLFRKKIEKRLILKDNNEEYEKLIKNYYKYLSHFQQKQRKIHKMYEFDDLYEEMTRQFQVLDDQMKQIKKGQRHILSQINSKYSHINERKKRLNINKKFTYMPISN